jgi:hypothetical protein
MDITIDYWLNYIAKNTNKKHYKVRKARQIVEQEISDLRFNALNRIGGQFPQYLMNHWANVYEKQLEKALS